MNYTTEVHFKKNHSPPKQQQNTRISKNGYSLVFLAIFFLQIIHHDTEDEAKRDPTNFLHLVTDNIFTKVLLTIKTWSYLKLPFLL